MPYALSVFLPECGINQDILNKNELVEVMKLDNEENNGKFQNKGFEFTPLLMDIVEMLKKNKGSLRPNMVSSYIQTEETGEEGMSLD